MGFSWLAAHAVFTRANQKSKPSNQLLSLSKWRFKNLHGIGWNLLPIFFLTQTFYMHLKKKKKPKLTLLKIKIKKKRKRENIYQPSSLRHDRMYGPDDVDYTTSSFPKKKWDPDGGNQIFSSFSALIKGLARAISSRPTFLKSNEHPCFSGYRWVPQKMVPHLHLKPVNPIRFLQTEHRFGCGGCCCCCCCCSTTTATSASLSPLTSGRAKAGGSGRDPRNGADDEGGEAEREFSTVVLIDACCCSLRQWSR